MDAKTLKAHCRVQFLIVICKANLAERNSVVDNLIT